MINETGIIDEDLFTSKIKEPSKKEVEKKSSPKLNLPKSSNSTVATVDKMILKVSQISIGQQNFEINSDGIAKLVKKIQESLKNNDQKTLQEIGSALENLDNLNFLFVILKDLIGNNSKAEQTNVRQIILNLSRPTQAKIFSYDHQDSLLTIENIFNEDDLKKAELDHVEAIKAEIVKLKISDKSGTVALGGKGFAVEKDILLLDKLISQLDPKANTATVFDELFQQDGQKYIFCENFDQKVQSAPLNEDSKKLLMIYQLSENRIYLSEDELKQPPIREKIELITKYVQASGNIFMLDSLPQTWKDEINNKIIHSDFAERKLVNLLLDNRRLGELSLQAKKNNENTLSKAIGSFDFVKNAPFLNFNFPNFNFAGNLIKTRQTINLFENQLLDFKQNFISFRNNILKTLGHDPELKELLHNIEDLVARIENAELEFAGGIIEQDVFEKRIEYAINQLNIIDQKTDLNEKPEKLTAAFISLRNTIEKNHLTINSLTFQILNDYLAKTKQSLLSEKFTAQNNPLANVSEPIQAQEKIFVILNNFLQENNLAQVLKVIKADNLRKQELAEKLLHERLEFDKQIENKIKKNKEALATMEKIIQLANELLKQINKTKLVGLIVNIENFLQLIASKENDLPQELTKTIKELEKLKVKMRERFPEIFR